MKIKYTPWSNKLKAKKEMKIKKMTKTIMKIMLTKDKMMPTKKIKREQNSSCRWQKSNSLWKGMEMNIMDKANWKEDCKVNFLLLFLWTQKQVGRWVLWNLLSLKD